MIVMSKLRKLVAEAVAPWQAEVRLDGDCLIVVMGDVGFVVTDHYARDYGPELTAKHAALVVQKFKDGEPEVMLPGFTVPVRPSRMPP